jgi:hypothetical protein
MEKGRCKHCRHEGLKITCALGLDPEAKAKAACPPGENYRDGLFYRIPCDSLAWHQARRQRVPISGGQLHALNHHAECDQFADPTDAELAQQEEEMNAFMKRMDLLTPVIQRIKREHDQSWRGVVPCPVCGGGELHLKLNVFGGIHGRQKHLHGKCATDLCVAWME